MLTTDQIDALSQRAEQISDILSDFLIGDIAERISEAGQLTGTASYEVWRLQNLGVSQDKLKKELKKRLNISLSEVEDLLKQSAEAGYNFDISRFPTADAIPFAENTSLQQIVNAAVQMAQEDFSNIVQTIGFVGPDGGVLELTQAYQQACDYAFQKAVTGTQDMYSAIREATRNLAEKGIRFIDYESGVHTSMEAAVRRCVMGGMGLMQEKISQDNHDYLGCDGWEISAHHGCAPDHEPIQGKQYDDKTYQSINGSLQRRIGTLNCGHAAFPIIMGVNSPQYSAAELEEMRKENEEGVTFEGRHYSLYDATQRQRKFERSIRKQKRRILIDQKTGDTEKLQADQIRLVRLRQEYARFSKGTGLRQQWERAETAGFTWKHGNAAEKTARDKAAASREIKKFFGTDSTKDLKSIVKRSTMKTQGGFACFPDGDSLNKNILAVTPQEGFFDVAMHGSPTAVGFGTKKTNMSARLLASVIRHSKGYTGQDIRLLSCSTGKIVGDDYCFAEELANALGVRVSAPTDTLYVSEHGNLQVGDYGDGSFITYEPNRRGRIK